MYLYVICLFRMPDSVVGAGSADLRNLSQDPGIYPAHYSVVPNRKPRLPAVTSVDSEI